MATRINWKQSLGMMAFGMPFFAAGVFLVLAGTGILPIDKSYLGGPQWLLAFVGLAFGLPGWFCMFAGAKSLLRGGQLDTPSRAAVGAVVAVVLSCMAIVCLGAALFGKAESFFGGISLFGARLGFRDNNAILTRVIFGLAGFLIAGIAWLQGYVSVAGLRAQRRKERKGLSNNRLDRTTRDDD